MTEHFYVPTDTSALLGDLNTCLATASGTLADIARAFIHNLEGAVQVASVPFALASASTHRSHYQRIFTAERIRARGLEGAEGEDAEALEKRRSDAATRVADDTFREFVSSDDGRTVVIDDICRFLVSGIREGGLEQAAGELLSQSTVLVWGALEVVSRDLFVAHVNSNPTAVQGLLSDASARKRFDVSNVSLDVLLAHNFNLSSSMGAVLAAQQDMSDLLTIRAVYGALFPGNERLLALLNDRRLWILSHNRHLIVHRRGVVDERYVHATGSRLSIGTRLRIPPSDFDTYLELVRDSGKVILDAVSPVRPG
jgi:hypothetical protein